MVTSFRITAAGTVLAFAMAAAVPTIAQPAPPDVAAPNGEACSPTLARWQSAEAAYSAMDSPDLDAYNAAQNAIDRAVHACEAGRDAEAKAVMDASKRPPPRPQ